MPFAENFELLHHHDLDGRTGFKVAMVEQDGRFILYVAGLFHSGWSILDVTDPSNPELIRWIDGPENTWTLQVQAADGLLITSLQHIPPGWGGNDKAEPDEGVLVWSIEDPTDPQLLGRWRSGAYGTHRNYYTGGRYAHLATSLPGYVGMLYGALDLDDPTNPQLVGTWWWPGQHEAGGEEFSEADRDARTKARPFRTPPVNLHGGAYVVDGLAYCPWGRAGMMILDVNDPTHPQFISNWNPFPPLGSSIAVHSAVPLSGRDLVVVDSETLNEGYDDPLNYAGIVDVSDLNDPVLISLFPMPDVPPGYPARSFYEKGGRFGPHNLHQHQGHPALAPTENLIYMTYFNAGLQLFDISDPYVPRNAGYFIPDDPEERRGPVPKTLVMQAEDIIVDRRGFAYFTEKNSGLYVVKHTA